MPQNDQFDRIDVMSPAHTNSSDKKSLVSDKKSGKFTANRKIIIGTAIGLVGATALIFILFFIVYAGASAGQVPYRGFCLGTYSCMNNSNLTCVANKCVCDNSSEWNSTNCVPISLYGQITGIKRALSIFSGSPYNNFSIYNYSDTNFSSITDMGIIYNNNDMYILVVDNGNHSIIYFDVNGAYVKSTNVQDAFYMHYYDGYYYVTTAPTTNGNVHKFDVNFMWIASYYVGAVNLYGVTFNSANRRVYVSDFSNSLVRSLDETLSTYNASLSFAQNNITAVKSYKNYVYSIGLENALFVYDTVAGAVQVNYTSVCKTNNTYGMYLHEDSGYLLISCYNDKKVNLWYTNGSQAFFTGLFISTPGKPNGVGIDSYGRVIIAMQDPNKVEILSLK